MPNFWRLSGSLRNAEDRTLTGKLGIKKDRQTATQLISRIKADRYLSLYDKLYSQWLTWTSGKSIKQAIMASEIRQFSFRKILMLSKITISPLG